MDNAWTSKPTCAYMTMEIPTFLIVMIYLLSLHAIMFYFIFVHNYIWILDKAFNIDFCLLTFVHVLLFTIFPLQTSIVRHDEKTNRAIAIDHVTLNMYKHPIKSRLTRTPPEFNEWTKK
jgi:hypothetical protein